MSTIPRKYARNETMTPGFNRTIQVILERVPLSPGSLVLDVPCGKGEALVRVAGKVGADCIGVDRSGELLHHAAKKISRAGLGARASVMLGDGGRLPFPSGVFDSCLSIGGPSCINGHSIRAALVEQARVLKQGAFLVVSDIFRDPDDPNPWIEHDHPDSSGWWVLLQDVGLRPVFFEHLPISAWDEYHAPMRELVAEARKDGSFEKLAWADRVEREIASDLPGGQWANYGTFIAQKFPRD